MSLAPSPPRPETRTGVTYDEYVRLRNDPESHGLRMAYLDGMLELMSPEYLHEVGASDLAKFVVTYCETFDLDYQEAGSTTFRKGTPGTARGSGNEPDRSYYFGDAIAEVVGKDRLDLTVDPPPSLWIEVEYTTSSLPRRTLLARLGVPEVWRYRVADQTLHFDRLAGGEYRELAESVALPGLTPAAVLDALAPARTMSTAAWTRWLRGTWFPAHRQELLDRGAGR